jgi:hypothetical protein
LLTNASETAILNIEPSFPKACIRTLAPKDWHAPVVHSECSLHQLSPYIGKLKSSIAADIIRSFTDPGDLIADPFCGAGTVALEAKLAGRKAFASDISPYAYILTHGKLNAPRDLTKALAEVEDLLEEAEQLAAPDLRSVPQWVRAYFNPRTLKEALSFVAVCKLHKNTFALSCLLGILHHQRPGFLSYPSSHLVPYLRTKRFPVDAHPELYDYRPLRPRLLNKVSRAYKRVPARYQMQSTVIQSAIEDVALPQKVDAVITSPPYMNALDYGRDNRLRLWFIDPTAAENIDCNTPSNITSFFDVMSLVAQKAGKSLKRGGYCILVVGEAVSRTSFGRTANASIGAFTTAARNFEVIMNVEDLIPDVRRARRDCHGVKGENIIVLRKVN